VSGFWKLEIKSLRKLEAGSWKLEVRSWKVEGGRWKLEAGSWKLEGGRWNFTRAKCKFHLSCKHLPKGRKKYILKAKN
jgi:hypothetical protein